MQIGRSTMFFCDTIPKMIFLIDVYSPNNLEIFCQGPQQLVTVSTQRNVEDWFVEAIGNEGQNHCR